MKTFVALAALLASSFSYARQYFQCSTYDMNSTEVAVVNLQTPDHGTLFLSSGMQNPESERMLLKIELDKVEGEKHIFKVVESAHEGTVAVPSAVIGKSTNSVDLEVSYAGYGVTFSCFARMYHD